MSCRAFNNTGMLSEDLFRLCSLDTPRERSLSVKPLEKGFLTHLLFKCSSLAEISTSGSEAWITLARTSLYLREFDSFSLVIGLYWETSGQPVKYFDMESVSGILGRLKSRGMIGFEEIFFVVLAQPMIEEFRILFNVYLHCPKNLHNIGPQKVCLCVHYTSFLDCPATIINI